MSNLTVSPPPVQDVDTSQPNHARSTKAPVSHASSPRSEQIAQAIVLAVLFAGPALMCVHMASAGDPDIWWHIHTGQWILQHHAVPRVDPYSREFTGTPWLAYSWLFELLTAKVFQWVGVVGIVGYSATMLLAITVALRHLVHRLHTDFSLTSLLTFAACFSLGHLYTPRPWLFSILFFVLELDILMNARRTGRLRGLAWLPLIFALWANIHIEFIYGLFILGVAFVESAAARWRAGTISCLPLLSAGGVLIVSSLATLVNPFGWRLYSVIYNLVTQGGGLTQVSEMQAIPFRSLPDYIVLFLTLASVGALAWSRRFPFFESGMLLFATMMAFRSQRDVWVMSIAAAAIIAAVLPASRTTTVRLSRFAPVWLTVVAACLVLVGFRAMKVNNASLDSRVADIFPVHAVEAIRANGYPGPLFNDFNWGGYLIYALDQPVTIDGRTNLYGNDRMNRSIATWNAKPDWGSDIQLTSAGVIIGPVTYPLIQVLRFDPRFQLVYEDKLAAVFIKRKGH